MTESGGRNLEPRYGRLLEDFRVGEVYCHPWEVTIDDGLLAGFAASFLDPNPLYSSRRFARELGFRDRVVHPLLLLNLALSFSVHDVSEQAIAHLAYVDVRFPSAAYVGDTVSAYSEVIGLRVSESRPDRGVVHVRTTAHNQDRRILVTFERKAMIPVGRLLGRAHPDITGVSAPAVVPIPVPHATFTEAVAEPLTLGIHLPKWPGRLRGLFEDFEPGDMIIHDCGRTIGDSEHMQLAVLTRNSHPLHFDELYCRSHSFAKTRVVEGGLVFAWIAALASRDTTANALWEIQYANGHHPAPVLAGDTLYAASLILKKAERDGKSGFVHSKLVGVKNCRPGQIIREGCDLFKQPHDAKVFEIERSVLIPKRSAINAR